MEKLEEMIIRRSQLLIHHPDISELDMNPVVVAPDRSDCRVVDGRIRIAPPKATSENS